MRTLAIPLCCFMLLFTQGYGVVFTPSFETHLRSYINVSMNCHLIPGMTLTVVKGNETWSSGFGTADFSSGKQVDPDTAFNIASVVKSFTATLLGILLSENGHDWTTKVTDILGPDYEFIDDLHTKELTLRDLLSHRTGLAALDIGILAGEPHSTTRQAMCKRMKYLPERRPIRDGYIYNNYMYMMLAHVAEVLGKDTWENLVRLRIFEPLGMNSTRIMKRPQDVVEPDMARPYIYRNGQFENGTLELYDIHPVEPVGALLSSATDMAKWLKFNLHKGRTETGNQLIDEKLMENMHWATTSYDNQNQPSRNRFLTRPQYPADEIQIGYGYGWDVSAYRGYKNVWHSGGLFSYVTHFWTFPDMDVGMFASVNGPAFKRLSINHLNAVFYYLSDHLLGLEPWLNETTACTFPEPWDIKPTSKPKDPEVPITIDNSSDFEGSYSSPLLPTAVVTTNSSHIRMDLDRLHGILHPSSEKDKFQWEIIWPWEIAVIFSDNNNESLATPLTFLRDDAGAVTGMTMQLEVSMTYTKGNWTIDRVNGADTFGSSFVFYLLLAMLVCKLLAV